MPTLRRVKVVQQPSSPAASASDGYLVIAYEAITRSGSPASDASATGRSRPAAVKGVDLWTKRYHELVQYKAAHNDCNVPQEWNENPQLGRWVKTQRAEYRRLKEGKKTFITAQRIDVLNSIGFKWSLHPSSRSYDMWEQRFEELKQYKAAYDPRLETSTFI